MQKIVKKVLFTFVALIAASSALQASLFENYKKTQMIKDLEIIKHHFEVGYAPAKWKKNYIDWDLDGAFEQSKGQILATPFITTKQFQQIVRDFVKTTKDYHVDVMFFSTEAAYLPFSVKEAENRYFISWTDPLRLPSAYYGIQEGDELLEFDGHPIIEVMSELRRVNEKSSNQNTDQALATMKLTNRIGLSGDSIPKGPILITTQSAKTGKIITHQLRWSYTPEQIKNPLDFTQALDFISFLLPKHKKEKSKQEELKIALSKITMANPMHQSYAQKFGDRKGQLGSRKSFLPLLGKEIWSNERDLAEGEENPFWYAYIYHHPQGYKIGYIRIPHYIFSNVEVKEFGKIINMMEENTDALVIDQLHNFGGFVHTQYALASILAHQPLQTPYHRIKITQKEVIDAYETLELIKLIEMTLEAKTAQIKPVCSSINTDEDEEQDSDEEESEEDEEEIEEGMLNYQELLFLKAYCELIIENWNNGQTLTQPTPILGIDKVNPHPIYQYTKPILMLIDEMDFSGGDFMPAMLQDNKRATLFGSRTAGAGGYVSSFQFPNVHGIAYCSYTASIAERVDLQKIENLGVTPDIEYKPTSNDIQNGYHGYIEGVNQAVQHLLNDKELILNKNEID